MLLESPREGAAEQLGCFAPSISRLFVPRDMPVSTLRFTLQMRLPGVSANLSRRKIARNFSTGNLRRRAGSIRGEALLKSTANRTQ